MKNIDKAVVNRRNFLRFTGLSGAALDIGYPLSIQASNTAFSLANLSDLAADFFNLNPYIIIEKSGKITLFNTRPEMGQGTYQSVSALIAEELETFTRPIHHKTDRWRKTIWRRAECWR